MSTEIKCSACGSNIEIGTYPLRTTHGLLCEACAKAARHCTLHIGHGGQCLYITTRSILPHECGKTPPKEEDI